MTKLWGMVRKRLDVCWSEVSMDKTKDMGIGF